MDFTELGPIANPSVLIAILPSRANNSEANSITFPLIMANLLQVDVHRLPAFMASLHRQRHIHKRPFLDLVVGSRADRAATRAAAAERVLRRTILDSLEIGVVGCDHRDMAPGFIEAAGRV